MSIKTSIRWINEALAVKDIGPAMTHYRIMNNEICATNGKITAAHPWPFPEQFLVSGIEFEKILSRMGGQQDNLKLPIIGEDRINIRSGRFHDNIYELQIERCTYAAINDQKV